MSRFKQNALLERDLPGLGNEAGEEVLWQKYYQWVSIVLSFQAMLFYLPRYLWKTWEAGRMRLLLKDLVGPLVTPSWTDVSKNRLISYMVSGRYAHNIYAFRYAVCEILNLANAVSHIL